MTARKIAIVGLGLIGGSLGLALKQGKGDELEVLQSMGAKVKIENVRWKGNETAGRAMP